MPAQQDDILEATRQRVTQLEDDAAALRKRLTGLEDEIAIASRRQAYDMSHIGIANLTPDLIKDWKYYKNLVANSSFECPGPGRQAAFWTAGACDPNAAWYGTCSMRLKPGESTEQTDKAYVSPSWYGGGMTWVAFLQKGGSVRATVLNTDGRTVAQQDYPPAPDWTDGKRSIYFEPGLSSQIYLRFTSTDAADDVFIDAVQMEPDHNSKWPGLYTDGPFSLPTAAPSVRVIGVPRTLSNDTWTGVQFATSRWDTDACFDPQTTTWRIYCHTPGIYVIMGNVGFQLVDPPGDEIEDIPVQTTAHGGGSGSGYAPEGGGSVSVSVSVSVNVDTYAEAHHLTRKISSRGARLLLNGTTELASQMVAPSDLSDTNLSVTAIWQLAKYDYIELQAYANQATEDIVSLKAPLELAMVYCGE